MSVGTIVIITVVVLGLVVGLGYLILTLMRRSQDVVPRVAENDASHSDRVVAVDDEGRPITESEAGDESPPRDNAGFEAALKEELDELGR